MKFSVILMSLIYTALAQHSIPFRDETSYKFILDYNFKAKPPPPKNYISWRQESSKPDLLPYVKVTLQMLKVMENDYRVKVMSNKGHAVFNKRIKKPLEIDLDIGFTEDIIDRIVPHLYYVQFFDASRNIQSQVIIEVTENGYLLVNEQVYGQL